MMFRRLAIVFVVSACTNPAFAQQRPLVTEDPEPVGAGRILLEGGFDVAHDQRYPTSGLRGNLWRVPTIGLSFGLSSIAELQVDGAVRVRLWLSVCCPAAALDSLGDAT